MRMLSGYDIANLTTACYVVELKASSYRQYLTLPECTDWIKRSIRECDGYVIFLVSTLECSNEIWLGISYCQASI
jgi:hypothetical protein